MSSRSAVNQTQACVCCPRLHDLWPSLAAWTLTLVNGPKGKKTIWQPYGLCCRAGNNEVRSKTTNHPKECCICPHICPLWIHCYIRENYVLTEFIPIHSGFTSVSRGRQTLRVREHKVLGPYVDGLSRLAVACYKVTTVFTFRFLRLLDHQNYTTIQLDFVTVVIYKQGCFFSVQSVHGFKMIINCIFLVFPSGHWVSHVGGEQISNRSSHQHEWREQSIACRLQHHPHTHAQGPEVWGKMSIKNLVAAIDYLNWISHLPFRQESVSFSPSLCLSLLHHQSSLNVHQIIDCLTASYRSGALTRRRW